MSERAHRIASAAELRAAVERLAGAEVHFHDLGLARLRGLVGDDEARQAHEQLLQARERVRALAAPDAASLTPTLET